MAINNRPVILITGVSGGIGQATSRVFLTAGWTVVGTVRTPAKRRGGIDLQPAEMTRHADLTRVMAHIDRTYGRLDALVCNAGYGLVGPLETLGYAQMRDQLAVNVLAPAELTRLALPLLERSGGAAVGVSSIVGLTGLAGYSVYAASKHALEGLYESLALEYADTTVRFKLIEPSGVNTGFWTALKRGKPQAGEGGAARTYSGQDHGLTPESVAAEIYRAVTDRSVRLRYPLGQTARLMLARRLLPESLVRRALRRFTN